MTTKPATTYTGPLPNPERDDEEFWEGCKQHEFRLMQCKQCGRKRLFGNPMCSHCNSLDYEAVVGSGRGTVWSWTTTQHAFSPVWRDRLPYNLTVVQLDEGLRFTTIVVDCPESDLSIGMPVEVAWEDVTEEFSLPKFRPAKR